MRYLNIITLAVVTMSLLFSIPLYAQSEPQEPVTSTKVHNDAMINMSFRIYVMKPGSYTDIVTKVDWTTNLKKNQTTWTYVDLYADPDNDAPLRLKYSIAWYERPEGVSAKLEALSIMGDKSIWVDLNGTSVVLSPGQHTKDLPHQGLESAVRLALSTGAKSGKISFDVIVYGYIASQPEQTSTIPSAPTSTPTDTPPIVEPASDFLTTLTSLIGSMVSIIMPWALPIGIGAGVTAVAVAAALRRRRKGRLLPKRTPGAN